MKCENKELLINAAADFGIAVREKEIDLLNNYYSMLIEWNKKVNLTSIVDEDGVVTKHFIDSFSCGLLLRKRDIKSLVDIGTGAGFPGIPLAIALPELRVVLLESLNKRTVFLKEVVLQLGLENVTVVTGRAEDKAREKEYREQFECAAARAVAKLRVLAELGLPFVENGGIFIAMKGPDVDVEVEDAKNALTLLGGKVTDVKRFVLPGTADERTLVEVEKVAPTPDKYPRRSGMPEKRPL